MVYRHYGGMHLAEMSGLNQFILNASPLNISKAKHMSYESRYNLRTYYVYVWDSKFCLNLERVKYYWFETI